MMDKAKLARNWIFFAIVSFSLTFSNAMISGRIGINYGRNGDNLPSAFEAIEHLQNMNAYRVKIFDASPEVLKLLSGTKLQVSIMIPNEQLPDIASNQDVADQWVIENVLPYYPKTMIRYIMVGNEVLSVKNDTVLWYNLVPAMINVHNAIKLQNISNIKIGTPLAMDIMESTFPPSNGKFRDDMPVYEVLVPLLNFLNKTNSFFFVNVYPYLSWLENPNKISLDFALFTANNSSYNDPGSSLNYTNLLDQMLDSVHFAALKIGYENVSLAISETGWPHSGDIDQPGANIHNAATYNRNLIRKTTAFPPLGTPARPGVVIPTFIFSLFDENLKPGPRTERNWGLLNPNGKPIYELDLTGARLDREYSRLPEPWNNLPFKGKIWCVAAVDANVADLRDALDLACNGGNGICESLAPLKDCYQPLSEVAHASYAFSSYWAKYRNSSNGVHCHFNGLAMQTTIDPSHGSCRYPSVTL
ncbi:OLC1v1018947C1 [Oldenlandia corymbosa var. corymbosa]|uniref:glucan endo-1,3-beta-D-glucosidase n=1 Tax=Oldenlandia corymbosa var. corymbosa TaxID=529605 RepID=A0AAV1ECW3_OLDCO|nr:OLC1v1018947C1 [Oldenlandia corymbosa var. corymbosa]